MSWIHKPAIEQRIALDHGEISSLELLEETIAHTEQLIPFINPIALKLYDRARKAAMEADKNRSRTKVGPLSGLPITIKDSQWLAGVPCANGSVTLKDFIPQQTSQAVERLENAGAIIFAKTTCPEFSLSGITESELYGRTSNPWDLTRTPGGSSGGAAVSVAAGIGCLSLGGDGGGSIRIPAAFCGVTGFKPTHGVVPRSPGFSTWESLVAYGPLSRTVSDALLMHCVLSDTDYPASQVKDTSRFSCVVSEDLGFAPVDQDVRYAFRAIIEKIVESGNAVKYGNPGLSSSAVPWAITATHDMWQHKVESADNALDVSSLGAHAQGFIEFGGSFTKLEFEDMQAQREKIHDAYMECFRFNNAQLLITPTLGCEAFPHGTSHPQMIEDTVISYPWLDWAGLLYDANLTGMPACSIPMGVGDQGIPLGLQIIGPPGHDLEVLNAARQIEKLVDWQSPEFNIDNYRLAETDSPLSDTYSDVVSM